MPRGNWNAQIRHIGRDDARDVRTALEEVAEEILGGCLVPSALDVDIQDGPGLIYGQLEVVPFPIDFEEHVIHVPFVAGFGAASTELVSIRLAKLFAPLPHRLIGHIHAVCSEQLFDVSIAEVEAGGEPNRM